MDEFNPAPPPLTPPLLQQSDSFTPEWTGQDFELLVHDPAAAVLEVVVKDEHKVGRSVLLGKGTKAVAELTAGGDAWTGWVELQVGASFCLSGLFWRGSID